MVVVNKVKTANRRGALRLAKSPVAIAARYDRQSGRLTVELSSGMSLAFKPQHAQGLELATHADLRRIEISPSGLGLHIPALDADLYLPGLLEGLLGSRRWMAAHMGKAGGRRRSVAKTAAARANGKLGGRPRKIAVPASR